MSPRPRGCDRLWLGFLSQACSPHKHPPTSFCTHVCTCICPILGQHLQALGLSGMPGFPGQHSAFGHQKPWLLSAALASRIFPWQVVRALLLAEVDQILPVQAGSAALQLTLVLLTATEEARLAQENQISSHYHHSPICPGQGPPTWLTRHW